MKNASFVHASQEKKARQIVLEHGGYYLMTLKDNLHGLQNCVRAGDRSRLSFLR